MLSRFMSFSLPKAHPMNALYSLYAGEDRAVTDELLIVSTGRGPAPYPATPAMYSDVSNWRETLATVLNNPTHGCDIHCVALPHALTQAIVILSSTSEPLSLQVRPLT